MRTRSRDALPYASLPRSKEAGGEKEEGERGGEGKRKMMNKDPAVCSIPTNLSERRSCFHGRQLGECPCRIWLTEGPACRQHGVDEHCVATCVGD